MSTPFKQAISICGLSQQEAADLLDVRLDTVKSWCNGRRTPAKGVWDSLGELYDLMDEAAEHALGLIREKQPDEIEFGYLSEHGRWPSAGCADTVEAMVRLRLSL